MSCGPDSGGPCFENVVYFDIYMCVSICPHVAALCNSVAAVGRPCALFVPRYFLYIYISMTLLCGYHGNNV